MIKRNVIGTKLINTLVIVEGMSDLVDQKLRVFEKTHQSVIDIDADDVFVFFEREAGEIKVLHPMIIKARND